MASRYYNPRLAQKVGAAEAGQYVSIAPAVAGGQAAFERQQAKQLKQQELRFEKRRLEAEAFKKEMVRRDDILYSVQKNLAKAKKRIDGAPAAIRDRVITLGNMAKVNYNQLQNAIKEGKLGRGAALMWQDDNVNKYIEQADTLLDKYPEIIKNLKKNKDLLKKKIFILDSHNGVWFNQIWLELKINNFKIINIHRNPIFIVSSWIKRDYGRMEKKDLNQLLIHFP